MKTIIRKLGAQGLCAAFEIVVLLGISVFYAYRYENSQILSGVGIGIVVGVLVVSVIDLLQRIDYGDSEQ